MKYILHNYSAEQAKTLNEGKTDGLVMAGGNINVDGLVLGVGEAKEFSEADAKRLFYTYRFLVLEATEEITKEDLPKLEEVMEDESQKLGAYKPRKPRVKKN